MSSVAERCFVFLKPGQMVVSSVPLLVTTLLGSCVAVTMFIPRLQLGAICHAQLPSCGKKACNHQHPDAGKYVDCAIMAMLEQLEAKGAERREIEAKLFGGSDMFDAYSRGRSVGRQNMEMAAGMLERESVRVVREDLGGGRGRKIVFHTHTGEVLLKRLRKSGGL